jgi:hypothetical protein
MARRTRAERAPVLHYPKPLHGLAPQVVADRVLDAGGEDGMYGHPWI